MNEDYVQWYGIVFGISEIGLALRRRASGASSQLADRGSLRLLWITIAVSVSVAYFVYYAVPVASFGAAAPTSRLMGIVLYASGLALRWYAIIYLGRFFTVDVAIATDHTLIDSGPYRHVRHPSYTGALLAFLGIGFALANWASLLAVTVPIFAVFAHRMRIEETALLEGLGAPYRAYMDRTKRLFPGIY
jgi:protein-S-isoprenylcysteine O-methyltransferase